MRSSVSFTVPSDDRWRLQQTVADRNRPQKQARRSHIIPHSANRVWASWKLPGRPARQALRLTLAEGLYAGRCRQPALEQDMPVWQQADDGQEGQLSRVINPRAAARGGLRLARPVPAQDFPFHSDLEFVAERGGWLLRQADPQAAQARDAPLRLQASRCDRLVHDERNATESRPFTWVVAIGRIIAARKRDAKSWNQSTRHDLNQGIVLKMGGSHCVGGDALYMLALLPRRGGVFGVKNGLLFNSRTLSWLEYPLLRLGRRLVLELKSIASIMQFTGIQTMEDESLHAGNDRVVG